MTTVVLWLFIVVGTCYSVLCSEDHLRDMDSFISAVEQAEESNPDLSPLALVRRLRRTAGHEDPLTLHFLGASNNISHTHTFVFNTTLFGFFDKAIHHFVTDRGEERGVVLTQDGTTVAIAPMLLGIEVGLKAKLEGTPPLGMFPLTLAKNLGLSFLSLQDFPPAQRLGPDGCWDNVTHPRVFQLSRVPTLATDALVNGGMDGSILGMDLATLAPSKQPGKLSKVLKGYYNHVLEGQDLGVVSSHISPKRREIAQALLGTLDTQRQVMETLYLVWRLEDTQWIAKDTGVEKAVRDGMLEFVHRYWDCPTIIPRCQWGAAPYRGSPFPLALPLPFLYIHHTYEPNRPCHSFRQCSRSMRAMQRFHQEDRGWADIGYSFVVGSDGYIYEGRGWHHLGTHTRGQNSYGYGVAFIGNYSSSLPSRHALDLVRQHLAKCAVDGGRLQANFTLHGHRQLVDTSCPGDALYSEIRGWEHFGETSSSKKDQ
ncbi:N-acetylmuramoyl-L-alanine amidase [Salmo salar]|uniref:N-acetylmuramoyl-L-alanine amidase n=1 Tax=Salmo salar TaxID=8030 RepID=A0A1S3L7S4_SALSA|nr:N-acetylmuramoyl-L-alanine amidase-like [Salmo salar]|eukprot:XP_013987022.1 PREDICTED: N-acetylmuramoyl-L-alanine amidase-like [Salmo salar]